MAQMDGPLTLPPDPKKPGGGCVLHTDHGSAQPFRIVGHHVFPEFLQKKVYGKTKIHKIAWMCDNGHYAVHGLLDMIVAGEEPTTSEKYKNRKELRYALEGFHMFETALAAITTEFRDKNGDSDGT